MLSVSCAHTWSVESLRDLMTQLGPLGFYIQSQQPITIAPDHEPEPDAAILLGRPERLRNAKPIPSDVAYVIEVGDSSLDHDRTTKLRIYAAAGIERYAIVNLVDRCIEVYGGVDAASGTYRSNQVIAADGVWTIELRDGQSLRVDASTILP